MAKVKRTEKRALGETAGGHHNKRPRWSKISLSKGRKLIQVFVGVITEPLTGYGVRRGVRPEGYVFTMFIIYFFIFF